MRNICLVLEYEGTKFNGFQKQPNKNVITIQGELEKAIHKVTGNEVNIFGSGRTDTGVSSEEQYANFLTESIIDPEKLKFAINTKLPPEISVNKSFEVPMKFHARHSAIKRTYRYRILNSPVRSALRRNSVFQVKDKLNFEAMQEAWLSLDGVYDFDAFCKSNTDRVVMSCNIFNTECYIENDELIFFITADTFLRGMVRLLIGTLIYIGRGKLKPSELIEIIENKPKERSAFSFSAGAEGLSLIKVDYHPSAFINESIDLLHNVNKSPVSTNIERDLLY